MKKLLVLFSLIFLLNGCYDYVEIDDIVIITGMLIDYKDDEYEITAEVIENEGKTQVKVFTTKGKSIDECLHEISKISNKDLFISHLKVLILTESTITSNINYYDYFLREPKSKMNFYIYFVDDKYKKDILNIYKNNNGSSLYIKSLMEFNNKIFSSSTPVSFLDLIYKKMEYGISPIYPNLKIKEDNKEKNIYLENLIVFNNKEKIVLNDLEGIIYNILTNNLNKTILTIPCDDNNFSIILSETKTKYKWKNNILNLNTSLNAKINNYTCKYSLDEQETIDKLTKMINNYLKDNINDLINISKKNNIDFIGFGSYIYKRDKNYFDFKKDNWNNNLKNIKFNIKVKTIIEGVGETRK